MVPVGKHDQRRVGQPDFEIRVLLHQAKREGDVFTLKHFQSIRTACNLSKQQPLSPTPNSRRQQIVQLRQDERRKQVRWSFRLKDPRGNVMETLAPVDARQEAARV